MSFLVTTPGGVVIFSCYISSASASSVYPQHYQAYLKNTRKFSIPQFSTWTTVKPPTKFSQKISISQKHFFRILQKMLKFTLLNPNAYMYKHAHTNARADTHMRTLGRPPHQSVLSNNGRQVGPKWVVDDTLFWVAFRLGIVEKMPLTSKEYASLWRRVYRTILNIWLEFKLEKVENKAKIRNR